jgi:hypothetical protein
LNLRPSTYGADEHNRAAPPRYEVIVADFSGRIKPMRDFFRQRSLSTILFVLFLASWAIQFVFQLNVAGLEAVEHGQVFQWSEFMAEFLKDTFENWQSEFLQLFTFVVLAKHFIHVDSPQSRDGDDEMKEKIDRILKVVDAEGFEPPKPSV